MKANHLFPVLSLVALSAFAQVVPNKDYVTYPPTSGTREMIDNVPSALDLTNSAVYISGYTRNLTTGRDYLLIKYDLNGNILWQKTFDYSGLNDRALAIIVDNSGNVIITGEATSLSNGTDIITRKYDINGNLLWSSIYNGSANADDKGLGIVTDNSGGVYLCGYSSNTGTGKDFTVIHYNSSGVQQYVYTKNGTSNGDDIANAIAFFGNKLYVAGNITNTGTGADLYITRLNANNASVNWSKTENGTASTNDQGLDIKVQGNDVLVCGGVTNAITGQDYFFGKYNATNGITVFTKTYDGFVANDFATSLVLDASNTYAITGLSQNGSNYEYHTTKYTNSGVLSWVNKHKTNAAFLNVFPKIAKDNIANHFYVSGVTFNSSIDAALYQITPGGNQSWVDYHDGFGLRDAHVDLSVDNFGRIYLASLNEVTTNIFDIALIRYSQTPAFLPLNYNNISEQFALSHLYYLNNGEIRDNSNNQVNQVVYYSKFTNPAEYIQQNKISFCRFKNDTSVINTSDTLTRIDMNFVGANEFSKIYRFDIQELVKLNYFTNGDTNGITNVKGAARLMVPNIYSMIDLHITSNGKGPKYYFVVKPGGDPSNISIQFDGASSTLISGSDLKVSSTLGDFTFKKPDVYNITPSLTTPSITSSAGWISTGINTFSINTGTYNATLPLIIEFDFGKAPPSSPLAIANLDWSTHLGGSSLDDVRDVKVDNSNNLYVVGESLSNNFPNAIGSSIQGFNFGSYDGFISKFNNSTNPGVPMWTTYIGGENSDYLNSVDIGPNGDIFSVGGSSSTQGFLPTKVKAGAWAQGYQGPLDSIHYLPAKIATYHFDGLVLQVNANGDSLKWLTRMIPVSQHDDVLTKCKFDGFGNLFAVGYTRSPNAIMIKPTATSYTRAYNNGVYTHTDNVTDGWIVKFNPSGGWVWSTTIGASTATNTSGTPPEDILNDLAFDAAGDVYVAGYTQGNNYITAGGGSITGGNYDGVITRFDNNGVMKWSSHVGGSGYDWIYAINTNTSVSSNLYVAGLGQVGFPVTPNGGFYYDNTHNGGTDDVFFSVFNSSNNRIHSTFIGGAGFDEARDIEIDNSGVIHISGKTTNGPSFYVPATNNGYYSPAGKNDLFICSLFPSMSDLLWTGIIGGDGDDASGYGYEVEMAIDNSQQKLYLGSMVRTPTVTSYPVLGSSPTYTQNCNCPSGGGPDGSLSRFDLIALHSLVGISEITKLSGDILVYPNPTFNNLYVKLSDLNAKYNYVVYNSLGQIVLSGNLENYNNTIELNQLQAGLFFLEINNGKEKLSAKFIKLD